MIARELLQKNKDMNEKMLTLMDLTRAVLQKIKAQEKQDVSASNPEADYRVLEELDRQLKATQQRLDKEYAIVKQQ